MEPARRKSSGVVHGLAVDVGLCRGVRDLHWALVMLWVDGVVAALWDHVSGQLGVEACKGGHPLRGQAGGRDERLGHAHGHGDDVSQGEQGLRVGGPHVGMRRG